jgi:uncharacterized protein (TIGR01777 family)
MMDDMQILMAGSSGFLGTALRRHLEAAGHPVTQLVRGEPSGPAQVRWDPYSHHLEPGLLSGVDVVVNLAGAPLAHLPWTSSYRQRIIESRVATTATLSVAIARAQHQVGLVNASGINYYGSDRGEEQLDESSAAGSDFIADVCQQWENATSAASAAGARVALLRTAVVLDHSGGALKPLLLPFRLGIGGHLGSGRQWFPSISLTDYLRATTTVVTDATMNGPVNVIAPVPATNAAFTAELGSRLHRPTKMTVPAVAIKAALGDFGSTLVGGVRVAPRRLLDAGFTFAHPTIGAQLDAALR